MILGLIDNFSFILILTILLFIHISNYSGGIFNSNTFSVKVNKY